MTETPTPTPTPSAPTPEQYNQALETLRAGDKASYEAAKTLLQDLLDSIDDLPDAIASVRSQYPYTAGVSSAARAQLESSLSQVEMYKSSIAAIHNQVVQGLYQLDPVGVPPGPPVP